MTARVLMVQGTSSSAGKSLAVTALCRILRQDGYRVAPFKAQNMSLNSFVTTQGGEIGRAQAVQAEAAGIEPSVHMNPVLLKPQADATSQVVVLGRAVGKARAADYYRNNGRLLKTIHSSLAALREQYDIVVIEGAGSPVEVNLMDREIVNMRIARLARSPVLLVGDIDRGGVFASIVGTMQLLRPAQRAIVRGFIINKFRGDIALLRPGLDFLEKRCRRPVLGVIPYIRELKIAQEDSVYLDERTNRPGNGYIDIAVIRLPHISNYDDFDPLAAAANVRYVSSTAGLGDPDLIILPGTKSTAHDLQFLRRTRLAPEIVKRARAGLPLIGICGGFQVLGQRILDPYQAESSCREAGGLGLLNIVTTFKRRKSTRQVKATVSGSKGLLTGMDNLPITGYEIHMGHCSNPGENAAFCIKESAGRNGSRREGSVSDNGLVFGTYIHGLFHNHVFTDRLLNNLSRLSGKPAMRVEPLNRDSMYNELANVFRKNLDIGKIYEIILGEGHE